MNSLMMLISLSALAARGIHIAVPREDYLAAVGLLLTYVREQRGMQVRRITFGMLADQELVNACVEHMLCPELSRLPANLNNEAAGEVSHYESGCRVRNRYSRGMDYSYRLSCRTHSNRRGMRINRERRQSRHHRLRERENLMRDISAPKPLSEREKEWFEELRDYATMLDESLFDGNSMYCE